jgi:endonuclease III
MANGDIHIDYPLLREMCERAFRAYQEGKGIFRGGLGTFLPRFNLPPELEHEPPCKKPKDPGAAARYLFVMDTMERKSVTATNMRNGLRTWANPATKWVFDPMDVRTTSLSGVEEVCSEYLQYRLSNFAECHLHNCQKIAEEYGGDPRNIVDYNTVSQARHNLMEFKGIGTGIANLFITDVIERDLAVIRDPRNALLKVDVHKGRLPINILAINPNRPRIKRREVVEPLERAYWKVCDELGIDPSILDPVLWVIGSEVCAKRNYSKCLNLCPLETMCHRNIYESDKTAEYVLVEEDGIPVDKRRQKGQSQLFTEF